MHHCMHLPPWLNLPMAPQLPPPMSSVHFPASTLEQEVICCMPPSARQTRPVSLSPRHNNLSSALCVWTTPPRPAPPPDLCPPHTQPSLFCSLRADYTMHHDQHRPLISVHLTHTLSLFAGRLQYSINQRRGYDTADVRSIIRRRRHSP